MINLNEFVSEVNQIKEQYRKDEESVLLIHRSRLLEILGNFFGVEWDFQGEMVVKDQSLESEEIGDFESYYEKVDEIGSKDISSFAKEELKRDVEELIIIFHELQEEILSEDEEEAVSDDEEIIANEEEIL